MITAVLKQIQPSLDRQGTRIQWQAGQQGCLLG
jgi:hypothetical protein